MAATKRTPEIEQAIVDSVRNGAYAKHAAAAVRIDESTLYDWINADATFAQAIAQARAVAVNRNVTVIQQAADGGDYKAAAWYLERTQPDDFRARTSTEVSGPAGGPIEVVEVPTSAERAAELARILSSAGAV